VPSKLPVTPLVGAAVGAAVAAVAPAAVGAAVAEGVEFEPALDGFVGWLVGTVTGARLAPGTGFDVEAEPSAGDCSVLVPAVCVGVAPDVVVSEGEAAASVAGSSTYATREGISLCGGKTAESLSGSGSGVLKVSRSTSKIVVSRAARAPRFGNIVLSGPFSSRETFGVHIAGRHAEFPKTSFDGVHHGVGPQTKTSRDSMSGTSRANDAALSGSTGMFLLPRRPSR
jgi:hypothetical protein